MIVRVEDRFRSKETTKDKGKARGSPLHAETALSASTTAGSCRRDDECLCGQSIGSWLLRASAALQHTETYTANKAINCSSLMKDERISSLSASFEGSTRLPPSLKTPRAIQMSAGFQETRERRNGGKPKQKIAGARVGKTHTSPLGWAGSTQQQLRRQDTKTRNNSPLRNHARP